METSPRVWSLLSNFWALIRGNRNISTCVELTKDSKGRENASQKHLHERGAYISEAWFTLKSQETSPRAWSLHTCSSRLSIGPRNISTSVELTVGNFPFFSTGGKHLHERGAYDPHDTLEYRQAGNISTSVELTSVVESHLALMKKHLHERGAYPVKVIAGCMAVRNISTSVELTVEVTICDIQE